MLHALRFLIPLVLVPLALAPAMAGDEPARTVEVVGEATVRVAPDQAQVRLGVVTRADDPERARTRNEAAGRATLEALEALDIPEADIRMERLRLQPLREYDQDTRSHREIGFEAVRDISVRVAELDRLPAVIAAVIDAGTNRIHEVRYDLADREKARNEALEAAARNGFDKARVLAGALAADLGAVQSIREQQFDFGWPRARQLEAAATDAAAGDPAAYAAGEIEINARVEVIFHLRGGDAPWPYH